MGNGGYNWSSSCSDSGTPHSFYLSFSMPGVYSSGMDYRTYGFQLRCLSE
ncbi:hypothetical protein [uncultured Rikenella sp.]|nr:hypothetical protein [uncultured Rikenella sp.]